MTFAMTLTAPGARLLPAAVIYARVQVAVEHSHGLIMQGALAGLRAGRVDRRPVVCVARPF
jgi:hypothetical protein